MSIYTKSRIAADKIISTFQNEVKCTIQREVQTPDGAGGFTNAWSDIYANLECAIIPMSGNEIVQAHRLNYEATHNAYIRFSDATEVKSNDRILFDGRVFVIRDPRNIGEAKAAWKIRVQENVG
jgi:SPP1 family predicted phage head-tail adaptor